MVLLQDLMEAERKNEPMQAGTMGALAVKEQAPPVSLLCESR
jgi:hypothetical protein